MHFFDRYIRTTPIELYYKTFGSLTEKIVGEKTPSYIFNPFTMHLIKKHIPNVKLICMLRNPVDRYLSCKQMFNRMNKDKKFPHIGAINRGLYASQLEWVLELFPKDKVKLIYMEEFRKDNFGTAVELCNWLGATPPEKFEATNKEHNKDGYEDLKKELSKFYRPHNKRLYDMFGDDHILTWNNDIQII